MNNKGGKNIFSRTSFPVKPVEASLMPLLVLLEGSYSLILSSPSPQVGRGKAGGGK
jgi:hypothetical protein